MPAPARASRLRRRLGDERGVVAVLVAGMLVLFMALGAYAIDLSAGRQAKTKAQSTADAAAEAAAIAIENNTSPTTAATTIAQQNGASGSNIQVVYPYPAGSSNTSQVQVIISGSAGTSMANEIGHSSIPVSASAIAAVNTTVSTTTGTATNTVTNTVTNTTTQTITNTTTGTSVSPTCAGAGVGCLAIYAAATTSCGGDSTASSDPVVFGGGVNITGGTWSNGSLNLGGGGSSWGPLSYNQNCSVSPYGSGSPPSYKQNGNTFNSGYPNAVPQQVPWPLDYSTDFPGCSGASCTGPCANGSGSCATTMHTPSFCTVASNASSWSISTYNPATLFPNQIYCAVGGGSPNTPSSWTGALTVAGGSSSLTSSFVAGSITVSGGSTLTACGYNLPTYSASTCSGSVPAPSTPNYPLFYAISGTINASSGGNGMTGDWFVPHSSISVGGGTSFVGFLEAQTVNLTSGGIKGDGPADDGTSLGSTTTTTATATSLSTGTSTSLSTSTSTSTTIGSTTATSGSKLVG